jgi:hypothetical protein
MRESEQNSFQNLNSNYRLNRKTAKKCWALGIKVKQLFNLSTVFYTSRKVNESFGSIKINANKLFL